MWRTATKIVSFRRNFHPLIPGFKSVQTRLRIGTRGSALALTQTRLVIAALAQAHGWSADEAARHTEIVTIKTTGDRIQDRPLADIGGKGLFAKEIEEALLNGSIDCAVHSLKDMPAILPPGLMLTCHLEREDPRDAFVSKVATNLDGLALGAIVGTSSVRRQAILLNLRPDLNLINFRGNVDTRLNKLANGEAVATILAIAGLKRLGADVHARHIFSTAEMLPAVAQGAVGVELREDNARVRDLLQPANHHDTELAVTFERAFLAALDGSCKTPLAGLAERSGTTTFKFDGCVLAPNGRTRINVARSLPIANAKEAHAAGLDAGQELLARAGRNFFVV
ncbi:MAG: hydroxymethylbilane synthase [Alphaproteobacteria bacterium]|nr:hydroxymethylbilane synthase [Alphaproteobacteria bacterium]